MLKKYLAAALTLLIALCAAAAPVGAKTNPVGQTVGVALFYITNARGEEILVSQIPVATMEADMAAGKIDDASHNYSLLDRFTTTLHQEAQGFTVPAFIDYAKSKSTLAGLRALPLTLEGSSTIQFWEIDQNGYDDMDTYTEGELYGVPRYNFPLLYQYWDYSKQDYYDPAGRLSRAEVIDRIFSEGQPEIFLLSVRAFSQRYMVTEEKYGVDYNMENYWRDSGRLDNERTIRLMLPMTKDDLYSKTPTASDTRYWVANVRLNMANPPATAPLGRVAAPTATLTEAGDNYYLRLSCATPGATILYNHNFISPSFTPTAPYGDSPVVIPKHFFPGGQVTMTARAVKDGYADAGVVTLTLKPSGQELDPAAAAADWADVAETAWYYGAVNLVMEKGLFDPKSQGVFGVSDSTTRGAFAVALYRLDGSPAVGTFADFADITKGTPLSAAASWAFNNDVISGVGNNRFQPDADITREQIAAFLRNYARYKKADTVAAPGDLSLFPDGDKTAAWARESLAWAVGRNLIGDAGGGALMPKGTVTRAQAATMLQRLIRQTLGE
ncbi:MAG: S-layer homology domain-containing protein [Peptococcaceae bacterium]|jgi:hypothetical protein|nr:S-layer homology domain-containing protein [Peptococcaceae bacterium]